MRSHWLFAFITTALLLGGCATVPAPLDGNFAELSPDQATQNDQGTRVRWGGEIIRTLPATDQTCIEILARDLDSTLRPIPGDQQRGRFMACVDGFEDPVIFAAGREVTAVGPFERFRDASIGEFVYRYPVMMAESVHLWPNDVIDNRHHQVWRPWYGYGYYGSHRFRGGFYRGGFYRHRGHYYW